MLSTPRAIMQPLDIFNFSWAFSTRQKCCYKWGAGRRAWGLTIWYMTDPKPGTGDMSSSFMHEPTRSVCWQRYCPSSNMTLNISQVPFKVQCTAHSMTVKVKIFPKSGFSIYREVLKNLKFTWETVLSIVLCFTDIPNLYKGDLFSERKPQHSTINSLGYS